MKTIFSCGTSTRTQQIVETSKKLRKVNFLGDVYHRTKRTDLFTDIEATLDTNSGQFCGMYSSEGEEWRNHARRNNSRLTGLLRWVRLWVVTRKSNFLLVCLVPSLLLVGCGSNSSKCDPPKQLACQGAYLSHADLSLEDLHNADLHNAHLQYADLSNANLDGADLHYADLYNADLSGTILSNADLHQADLSSANLSFADLSFADLDAADLYNADLSYANLHSADLSYADLSYANLRYADLSYADLDGANLKGATMPDGTIHG